MSLTAKNIWKKVFLSISTFFFFFCLLGSLPKNYAATGEPQQVLESFLNTLRKMEFPIQNKATHDELVKQANKFLDLDSMGEKALAAHWKTATSEEQKEFLDLLWKLIEHVAYAKSHRFLGNYQVTFPKAEPQETGVLVTSIVEQEEASLNVNVLYHLYSSKEGWKIDDVILDGVSIIEDLEYQFDKIIQDTGSFLGLLERMQERLTEAQKKNEGL